MESNFTKKVIGTVLILLLGTFTIVAQAKPATKWLYVATSDAEDAKMFVDANMRIKPSTGEVYTSMQYVLKNDDLWFTWAVEDVRIDCNDLSMYTLRLRTTTQEVTVNRQSKVTRGSLAEGVIIFVCRATSNKRKLLTLAKN